MTAPGISSGFNFSASKLRIEEVSAFYVYSFNSSREISGGPIGLAFMLLPAYGFSEYSSRAWKYAALNSLENRWGQLLDAGKCGKYAHPTTL